VNISQSAKDLIKGLLQLDPSKRLTLDYYLASPWITNGNESSDTNNNLVVERLSKFGVGKTKFRAVAKTILESNKVKKAKGTGEQGGETTPTQGDADSSGASSSSSGPANQTQAAGASVGLEPVRETTLGDIIGSAGLGLGLGSARENEPSSSENAGGEERGHHKNAVSVNQIDASAGTLTTNRSERGGSVDGEDDHSFPTHSSGASSGPTIHEQQPSPAMAARPLEATS
jgi:serine/threonine protein kinase